MDAGSDDAGFDSGTPDAGFPFEPGDLRVTDYGALGDGVHDDRPAVQAALDAARAINGTVYFDPGVYLLASTTTPNNHLVESDFGAPFTLNLVGNQATLRSTQAGTTLLRAQGAWQSSSIRGLTFRNDHGVTTDSSVAIALEGTNGNLIQHWTIASSTFQNFSSFITTTGVNDVTIQGNDFVMELGRDSGAGTNEPLPTVGIWLFDNSGNDGITVGVKILDNHYWGCGTLTDISQTASRSCGDGFVFGRSIGTVVRGNAIHHFSAEGIFIIAEPTPGIGATVDQNVIDGTRVDGDQFGGGGWGIRADATDTVVTNNTILNTNTGIFSCSSSGCGGSGTVATGLQIDGNTITTVDAGTQTFSTGIGLIDVSSSSVTNNQIVFASGLVQPGGAMSGISLSGASSTQLSDAITVTGNQLKNQNSAPGGDVSGLFMQWSSNWSITANTVDGFSFGFDFLNQPGTQSQLDQLLAGNTLLNCVAPDRTIGSF